MSKLFVARRPQRRGLFLPMQSSKLVPSLIFPLDKTDPSELDELIRAQLEKLGITKESDVQAIVEKAEQDSEMRIKVEEARKELRRLMELKKQGATLMQNGFRKWSPVFFPSYRKV